MKFREIVNHPEILAYYEKGDSILEGLGYTDHSVAHTMLVAEKAAEEAKQQECLMPGSLCG